MQAPTRLTSIAALRDPAARSLSFFCTEPDVHVGPDLIRELIAASEANGKSNARICLHSSPQSAFHEMVILERRGGYFRPHRHLSKGESCHIIEGSAVMIALDDSGGIRRAMPVGDGHGLIARVEVGQWHTVLPLSEVVIYHESKPGPFLGPGDSVFPDWAPDASDPERCRRYTQELLLRAGLGS